MWLAWVAMLVFVFSPFGVMTRGELPPAAPWQLASWALLFVVALVAMLRARHWWPLLVAPGWLFAVFLAMELYYPCWSYSNAAWCGHFCDDDPCACTQRASYGTAHDATLCR